MPTFRHGRKTAILFDANNLSQYMNSAGVSNQIDASETTTFGVDAKTYITGIEDAGISLSGLFEGSENDPVLRSALVADNASNITSGTSNGTNYIAFVVPVMERAFIAGQRVSVINTTQTTHNVTGVVASSPAPTTTSFSLIFTAPVATASSTGGSAYTDDNRFVTVCQEGLTQGTRCLMASTVMKSYEIKSAVADVVSVSAELQADGGIEAGYVLQGATTVTGGSGANNGTTLDNGATLGATSRGYVAHLHVTANTLTTNPTIVVQHSTDNTNWTALATFVNTTASLVTAERLTSSSATVNRYVRAVVTSSTGTGSLTYSLAFSRR